MGRRAVARGARGDPRREREGSRGARSLGASAMPGLHPYYETHRPQMEEAMRQRLDCAEPLLREHLRLSDTSDLRREIVAEFGIVLEQMPYVGGAESRMTDFFMRLLGFMAIGRVLRRKGLPAKVIGDIEVETYKAHLLATPEPDRLRAGRQ